MSTTVISFLKSHPLLTAYTKSGLINITSLARYLKENNPETDKNTSIAAIGMDIRRYISTLPKQKKPSFVLQKQPLRIVARTNIQELIFDKNTQNRKSCLALFDRTTKEKYFSCIVEGEREIVIITDYQFNNKDTPDAAYHTECLGFISIDFSIQLRKVIGVYSYITSELMLANIPIHSFHTIGGEILILVKNQDLIKAQEVLNSALQM